MIGVRYSSIRIDQKQAAKMANKRGIKHRLAHLYRWAVQTVTENKLKIGIAF